jgi:hypothetical protein
VCVCVCVCVCVINYVTKYLNEELKKDRYFVNEVEALLREKPLRGSKTQKIHNSEDKTSYKALVLT